MESLAQLFDAGQPGTNPNTKKGKKQPGGRKAINVAASPNQTKDARRRAQLKKAGAD